MDWRVWALFCCIFTDNRDSPKLCIFTMYTVTLVKISSSIRRLWAHERINIVVYCMGNYHVNKVERTTLGSHDLAVSIFQNFLPISRSLSKCKISNTLTAISREVPLIPSLLLYLIVIYASSINNLINVVITFGWSSKWLLTYFFN